MCDYCGCIENLDKQHEAEDEERVSNLLQRGVIKLLYYGGQIERPKT